MTSLDPLAVPGAGPSSRSSGGVPDPWRIGAVVLTGGTAARMQGADKASIELDGDPFVALFSETAARAVVATEDVDALRSLATKHHVVAKVIGRTGGSALSIDGLFDVGLEQLREQSEGTLPALFG